MHNLAPDNLICHGGREALNLYSCSLLSWYQGRRISSLLKPSKGGGQILRKIQGMHVPWGEGGLLWGKKDRDDHQKSYKTTLKNTKL